MLPAAILLLAALAAPTAPSAREGSPRGRFIVGAPDRLAVAGDRQQPRRYERVESAVGAYADVDELVDATWLRHEVEGYARRAADCDRLPPGPCLRARRQFGTAAAIHLVRGEHAEMVWTSGHRAVRLGWRRMVTTPTGTMTVDEPPADFAAALAAEFPSDLDPASVDATWADDEVERRLYYVGRALEDADVAGDEAARLYFARAGLLAVEEAEGVLGERAPDGDASATPITARTRLAALRARRAAARQCAAPPPSQEQTTDFTDGMSLHP